MGKKLSFAVVGCGSRGRTYMRIAKTLGHEIRAIADTSTYAIDAMKDIAGDDKPRLFCTGEDLLKEERLADVALVSTQDAQHFGHASAALRQGYDVLLEKPAAQTSEEVEELANIAAENGCKLILCFVLRYTSFYRAVKRAIDEGKVGDVMTIQASEGVEPWHHCHSYVRGKWSQVSNSTPMIIAKCSHDTDLLAWFAGANSVSVTSHENQSYFIPEKAPEGATHRCTDGCPHLGKCSYDAHRYLGDQRNWLRHIRPDANDMADTEVLELLKTTDWGRCVYHCGQDTPDHQVVGMKFKNGVTADLTMTAFDTGRRIRIYGTKGVLQGATGADGRDCWLESKPHEGEVENVTIEAQEAGEYEGHGGGDFGLIDALPELLSAGTTGKADFIEGHRIGFAADVAAKENRVVLL
ncbi:MAG: Gfo/Idh/MocA family protein [Akkermansiaceae bacterium]